MNGRPDTRRRLIPALLGLLALLLGILALAIWGGPVLGLFREPERLEELLKGLGPAGPLAIIALQVAQVLAAPIPGQVVGLASGYLFGPWLGTLYSMIGLMLGTGLGVWLVRRWGRPVVERLVKAEVLARIDHFSQNLGMPLLFLVFLLPFLPDDAIILAAGLTDIPMPGILLAAFLGRLPGVLISAWLGTNAGALTPVQWAVIAAATIAIAAPVYYYRNSLEQRMWSLIGRIAGRRSRDE